MIIKGNVTIIYFEFLCYISHELDTGDPDKRELDKQSLKVFDIVEIYLK